MHSSYNQVLPTGQKVYLIQAKKISFVETGKNAEYSIWGARINNRIYDGIEAETSKSQAIFGCFMSHPRHHETKNRNKKKVENLLQEGTFTP